VPTIRPELVAVAVFIGIGALAIATSIASRHEPDVRRGRVRSLGPLVPWLGSLLVVVLLVRGSPAAAVVVGAATLLHAVVTRSGEALRSRAARRRAGR
jgi:xanthine/uracil/vitamin C permease (AzgA family)